MSIKMLKYFLGFVCVCQFLEILKKNMNYVVFLSGKFSKNENYMLYIY